MGMHELDPAFGETDLLDGESVEDRKGKWSDSVVWTFCVVAHLRISFLFFVSLFYSIIGFS